MGATVVITPAETMAVTTPPPSEALAVTVGQLVEQMKQMQERLPNVSTTADTALLLAAGAATDAQAATETAAIAADIAMTAAATPVITEPTVTEPEAVTLLTPDVPTNSPSENTGNPSSVTADATSGDNARAKNAQRGASLMGWLFK